MNMLATPEMLEARLLEIRAEILRREAKMREIDEEIKRQLQEWAPPEEAH